jgi:hypothetical protein
MYVDAQLLFSDAQAVTAAADSTNLIDLGVARDIGTGENLYVVVCVDVALTDGSNDSTVTVALQGDSTATITPDATESIITIPALAAAGNVYIAKLSPGSAPLGYRYINLKYTPNNGNLTTGSFTAFLAKDVQKYVSYADNVVIS